MYLQILFEDKLSPGDIEITAPATAAEPGRARLLAARIGKPQPGAPNSHPVESVRGGKFGFLAKTAEPPFDDVYRVEIDAKLLAIA